MVFESNQLRKEHKEAEQRMCIGIVIIIRNIRSIRRKIERKSVGIRRITENKKEEHEKKKSKKKMNG